MKPAIATTLCKVVGHPGLRAMAKTVRESGRESALLFWTCSRCKIEIISIEVDQPHSHRHTNRPASTG